MKGSVYLIYETVKEFCDKKGISIAKLEKKAGLGNGTISGWKNSYPRIDSVKAVADVLNVKVDTLLKE